MDAKASIDGPIESNRWTDRSNRIDGPIDRIESMDRSIDRIESNRWTDRCVITRVNE